MSPRCLLEGTVSIERPEKQKKERVGKSKDSSLMGIKTRPKKFGFEMFIGSKMVVQLLRRYYKGQRKIRCKQHFRVRVPLTAGTKLHTVCRVRKY